MQMMHVVHGSYRKALEITFDISQNLRCLLKDYAAAAQDR